MKELSIEEKAKAYDEGIQKWVEDNVPELKESEGEKWIPKEIAKYLKEKGGFRSCWLAWLGKQGEQKPAEWSKEDEWCLEQINFLIRNSYSVDDKVERLSNWLKSLKDRVQPQPKQEWSKEDKERIEQICDDLKCGMINFYANEVVKGLHYKEIIESNIEWLKSLRPQNTWKPSDEQLDSLYDVLNPCDGFNREVLESLYQDLKKLKE